MGAWELPAVVAVFLTWFSSPPASIADAAQREALRRQMLPKATHALTNPDVPAYRLAEQEAVPPAAAAGADTKPDAGKTGEKPAEKADTHDEAWWRARITTARGTVDHDQMMLDALQSQINGLTADFINRDDPAQKAQIEQQRNRALAELDRMKKQMADDKQAVTDILEEARKLGVPPGWLRGGL
jgi:hypothetical protein